MYWLYFLFCEFNFHLYLIYKQSCEILTTVVCQLRSYVGFSYIYIYLVVWENCCQLEFRFLVKIEEFFNILVGSAHFMKIDLDKYLLSLN